LTSKRYYAYSAIAVHAADDRLIDAAEDGFVKPIEEKGGRDLRHSIIYGDFISSERAKYSVRYNFGITMQPSL
jgi:hypothetical protein